MVQGKDHAAMYSNFQLDVLNIFVGDPRKFIYMNIFIHENFPIYDIFVYNVKTLVMESIDGLGFNVPCLLN